MGLISVNGKTITELGYKVKPGDEVRYENRVLRAEKPVYILLNKPKGYLTTTEDPQRDRCRPGAAASSSPHAEESNSACLTSLDR